MARAVQPTDSQNVRLARHLQVALLFRGRLVRLPITRRLHKKGPGCLPHRIDTGGSNGRTRFRALAAVDDADIHDARIPRSKRRQ